MTQLQRKVHIEMESIWLHEPHYILLHCRNYFNLVLKLPSTHSLPTMGFTVKHNVIVGWMSLCGIRHKTITRKTRKQEGLYNALYMHLLQSVYSPSSCIIWSKFHASPQSSQTFSLILFIAWILNLAWLFTLIFTRLSRRVKLQTQV